MEVSNHSRSQVNNDLEEKELHLVNYHFLSQISQEIQSTRQVSLKNSVHHV